MRFKRPIYRYLFYTAWLTGLLGLAWLVVAANGRSKDRRCKGLEVSINGEGEKLFIEKAAVLKSIQAAAKGSVVNRPFAAINLGVLERSVEKNPWVRDAELYFDTHDVLHAAVWERRPIARVFTTAGHSFYIDSTGQRLPLLASFAVRLPVVTGFVPPRRGVRRDSLGFAGLKEVLDAVSRDSFWTAQVGQIDITPAGKFELLPVVGSHVIRLGYGENAQQKLANLLVFYKQVLPKAGLAKYSALDLQFDGQVVAVRKGPTSRIDSIQLQKNIAELLRRKAAEQEPDDAIAVMPASRAGVPDSFIQSTAKPRPVLSAPATPIPQKPAGVRPHPISVQQKPAGNAPGRPAQKPKATMPKRSATR